MDKISCEASENRLQSIKDQRSVLLELKKINSIGKKKFRAIDGMLAEEQDLESQRIKLRCKNEIE